MRVSYREPVPTFATNALGTAHLLEAVRARETSLHASSWSRPTSATRTMARARSFKESDPLGGHDPYSASKAAAEIVVASYRDSFFSHGTEVALASARAGNVIGGGDWAEDRIVPDCIRALDGGQADPGAQSRLSRGRGSMCSSRSAVICCSARSWRRRAQTKSPEEIARYAQAFNFGPDPAANRTVRDLVEEVLKHWPGTWEQVAQEKHLQGSAAAQPRHRQGARRARLEAALGFCADGPRDGRVVPRASSSASMIDFTQKQIADYASAAAQSR